MSENLAVYFSHKDFFILTCVFVDTFLKMNTVSLLL